MLKIVYLLLMLRLGRCKDELTFGTKTVAVGEDVTVTCSRLTSEHGMSLYWIRFVSGNWPEFLGGTYNFDYNGVNKTPHIMTKQGPGTFILEISKAKQSDTGQYYCFKVNLLNLIFIRGELLIIKETEPHITTVIQEPPSNPVHPVTLQCSVLFTSERNTCTNHRVYWFRAGSNESHPSLIYAHGNRGDECESPEDDSVQKCIYSFSRNISSSDSGTYYCAVAACGHILFGDGTKLDIEAPTRWNVQNTVIFLLSASLTASVLVIAILIYKTKKTTCNCSNGVLKTSGDQQSQKKEEVSLVYSAPKFTKRKAQRTERRNEETTEAVYTDVSTLES